MATTYNRSMLEERFNKLTEDTKEKIAYVAAISTQKGGAGKTTTAITLATLLSMLEHRTLLIDLDPQGNATSVISGESSKQKEYDANGNVVYHKGVYELFFSDNPESLIKHSPYGMPEQGVVLDYIPAGDGLSKLADVLTSQVERARTYTTIIEALEQVIDDERRPNANRQDSETALKEVGRILMEEDEVLPQRLKECTAMSDFENLHNYTILREKLQPLLKQYDFIIMDNNPSRNLVSMNSMVAADGIISPAFADGFSAEGVVTIMEDITKMRKYNPGLKFLGVLLTSVKPKTKVAKDIKKDLEKALGVGKDEKSLCSRAIRNDNAIVEANTAMVPIYLSGSRRTKAGADYIHAAYDIGLLKEEERDYMLKGFGPLHDNYDFTIGG